MNPDTSHRTRSNVGAHWRAERPAGMSNRVPAESPADIRNREIAAAVAGELEHLINGPEMYAPGHSIDIDETEYNIVVDKTRDGCAEATVWQYHEDSTPYEVCRLRITVDVIGDHPADSVERGERAARAAFNASGTEQARRINAQIQATLHNRGNS